MSEQTPERLSQEQENLIRNTTVSGDLTFAPVQIGTKIETLIIESSPEKVTRQELNARSPYQGLKRFNFKDRDRFFGRDKLIAALFDALNDNSLNLVLGASGSGKSSLVRAGLIPELKKSLNSQTLYDFIFTPSHDPFDSLYRCLLSEEKDYSFKKSEAEIALEAQPDTLLKLIRTLKQGSERWLIFIDQFEELFTSCDDPVRRKHFIAGLVQVARAAEHDNSIEIILAMRSDFLEQFSFYPDLGAIANQKNIHLVTEMYAEDLKQAIEQPAAKHGVAFEDGLVEQIIEEIEGQKGGLPLLQYTLNLLWERECQTTGTDGRPSIENRILTKKSYAILGGVRGALQKRINEIYDTLSPEEQACTKQIFLRLVNIVESDATRKAVSRRAYRDEFAGASVEKLLDRFVGENLLVSSGEYRSLEPAPSSNGQASKQAATVEIAHEILLSSWDQLKRWIDEEKELIIFKNWLAGETKRWAGVRAENELQAQDELLKGSRLAKAIELRDRDALTGVSSLSLEENDYITASIELHERDEAEKTARRKREVRTAWGITVGSMVAVLVSSSLGWAAWNQSKNAELNLALALASSSSSFLKEGKDLDALIQSIKAGDILTRQRVNKLETVNTLQKTLYESQEKNRLQGHSGAITGLQFSPDGKTVVTGSADNTIKLWDVETGRTIQLFQGHTAQVSSVSFSADGKTLATGSFDQTIKLWDVGTGKEIRTLQGHGDTVSSVSFSPDGKTLATGSYDQVIKLWDVGTGKEIRTLQGHAEAVSGVSFSPDGKTLATSSFDLTAKVWDVATGKEIRTFQGHENAVSSVSFSPDGQFLATGSFDDVAKLWDVKTGKELQTFEGHTDAIKSVSFSPDGKTLAIGSGDGLTKLWDIETGSEIRTFQSHAEAVNTVSFSPDGKILATGGDDFTAKLWNLDGRQEIRVLQGHQNAVWSAIFSPDGKTMATGSFDLTVKLWDAQTGKELQTFAGHKGYITTVAFSSDGKTLVSGGEDRTIKLWDVATGKEIRTFQGHEGPVNGARFGPNDKTLVTGSFDKTVRLWDVATGKEIRTFRGHEGAVSSVSFSPDGKTLVSTSGDKTIRVWDVETGKELQKIQGHTEGVVRIRFSPDGKTAVTGSFDKTLKLWDATNWKELRTFQGHTDAVTGVSFSRDGKTVISGSFDKTIRVWDVETGQTMRIFQDYPGKVTTVAISPDGQTMATGSYDKVVKLWDLDFWMLDLGQIMERSCNAVRAYLANRPEEDGNKHLCDRIPSKK